MGSYQDWEPWELDEYVEATYIDSQYGPITQRIINRYVKDMRFTSNFWANF